MTRRARLAFAVVQGIGLLCFLIGPHILRGGVELFFSGFALLLPGSLVGVAITEFVLWRPLSLGMGAVTVSEVMLSVLTNIALAWSAGKVYRAVKSRGRVGDPPRSS
jgi:hypothetical protein